MKTWKTIALTIITTSSLAIAGALTYSHLQPSHYNGDTFKNEKTISSTTTSSASVSSSNSSTSTSDSTTDTNSVYTEPSHTEQVEQNIGSRAFQPTFRVECVSPKNELYTVEHIPSGDKTKPITYEEAEAFCQYMEQIAYGKTTLQHTMDENYNTFKSN